MRKQQNATIGTPWADWASHTLEILDRITDMPILVPSSPMIISKGRKAEAEQVRNTYRAYFSKPDDQIEEEPITEVTNFWPPQLPIPESKDNQRWDTASRLFHNLKATIACVNQKFSSQGFEAEEEDDAMLDSVMPHPRTI